MKNFIFAWLYKLQLLPDRRATKRLESQMAYLAGYRAAMAEQQAGFAASSAKLTEKGTECQPSK
jgi:hypothetical protein